MFRRRTDRSSEFPDENVLEPQGFRDARFEFYRELPDTFPPELCEPGVLQAKFSRRLKRYLDGHWERLTGVSARETNFAALVPIHNEEYLLPSMLESLFQSFLPSKGDISIMLITNGCADGSHSIAKNFLESRWKPMGSETRREESRILEYRSEEGFSALLIDTPVASKAHAQNLGNSIALKRKHPLLLSVDANNWLEPESLAALYRDAVREILTNGSAALVGGTVRSEARSARKNARGEISANVPDRGTLRGALLAWDPRWLSAVGGVPVVATEDMAASVLAMTDGAGIMQSESPIWAYHASSLSDVLATYRRFIRGVFQAEAYFRSAGFEDAQAKLSELVPYHRPFLSRLKAHLSELPGGPVKLMRKLVDISFAELARVLAVSDFRVDPKNSSWTSISSTKERGRMGRGFGVEV